MEVDSIIAQIDAQIAKLTEARQVLQSVSSSPSAPAKKAGRGRPKGSKNASTVAKASTNGAPKKRKLSPEGRKAIADAMKRRWAERKSKAAQ